MGGGDVAGGGGGNGGKEGVVRVVRVVMGIEGTGCAWSTAVRCPIGSGMTGEGGCKGTAREGTRDAARTVGMVEMVGTARTMEEMVM